MCLLPLKNLLVFCVFLCLGYSKKFPPYITVCQRNDPELNACVRTQVHRLQPHLSEGVTELLIPSMDPLVIPKITLDSGPSFKAIFTNIQLYHASDFLLDDIQVDLSKLTFVIRITFPKLRIKSDYQIDGRILILQLKGSGPSDGNYTNVQGLISAQGSIQIKNGKEHLKVEKLTTDLKLGKPRLWFDGIFGDNTLLNEQTNRVINDNIEGIVEELKPVLTQAIEQFTTGIVNRIFDKFTYDELFPK